MTFWTPVWPLWPSLFYSLSTDSSPIVSSWPWGDPDLISYTGVGPMAKSIFRLIGFFIIIFNFKSSLSYFLNLFRFILYISKFLCYSNINTVSNDVLTFHGFRNTLKARPDSLKPKPKKVLTILF